MPQPSSKTAWDFLPADWRIEATDREQGCAGHNHPEIGEHIRCVAPEDFEAVHKVIEEKEIATESAEITALPEIIVTVGSEKDMEKVMRLVDLLEDHDDVQAVYSNAELG